MILTAIRGGRAPRPTACSTEPKAERSQTQYKQHTPTPRAAMLLPAPSQCPEFAGALAREVEL
jgi:hypothetical protein